MGFTQINGSYVLFLVPSVYESNKMCHTPAAQVLKMKAQPQERRAKHPKAIMVQPWQNRLVRKHWIYVISMDISISAYKIYYIVYNICIYTYVYIYIHIYIYTIHIHTYVIWLHYFVSCFFSCSTSQSAQQQRNPKRFVSVVEAMGTSSSIEEAEDLPPMMSLGGKNPTASLYIYIDIYIYCIYIYG